ncbi:MAG: acyltransferase [Rubripirellula sp.]
MDVLPLRLADASRLAEVSPPDPPAKANLAGLDAVRGFAALGVVLLHSCAPYLLRPMPGLAWSMRDTSSPAVDFCFWSIEVFIMPLFLVMAGFFAWQSLSRRGEIKLIKSRAKRLLLPLLFGILVILPLDLYCWVLGWVTEGLIAPVKLKSLKFDGGIDRDLWGLSHLWFLQYLFLYVVSLAIAYRIRKRFTAIQRVRITPKLATALILLAGTLTLYVRPEVVWGFQHAFLPVPSKWIYSGMFFAFGSCLAAHDGSISWLKSHAGRLLGPAIALLIATVFLGQWQVGGGEGKLAGITLAGLTSGSALLTTLTILGVAVARIKRIPTSVQYLAAASFWVYLVHHPILGLIHIDLKWLLPELSPLIKTVASFALSTLLSLVTYEVFVRRTFLGRWLGFQWEFPVEQKSTEQEIQSISIGKIESAVLSRRAA